jgi:hypothetical protein
MKYNTAELTLAKLYDDTHALRDYHDQILGLIRKEYYKKNIDFPSYERFVNVLTCTNLHIEDMKEKLNSFIELTGSGTLGMKVNYLV